MFDKPMQPPPERVSESPSGVGLEPRSALDAIANEIVYYQARQNHGAIALLERARKTISGEPLDDPMTPAEAERYHGVARRDTAREMWGLVAAVLAQPEGT